MSKLTQVRRSWQAFTQPNTEELLILLIKCLLMTDCDALWPVTCLNHDPQTTSITLMQTSTSIVLNIGSKCNFPWYYNFHLYNPSLYTVVNNNLTTSFSHCVTRWDTYYQYLSIWNTVIDVLKWIVTTWMVDLNISSEYFIAWPSFCACSICYCHLSVLSWQHLSTSGQWLSLISGFNCTLQTIFIIQIILLLQFSSHWNRHAFVACKCFY